MKLGLLSPLAVLTASLIMLAVIAAAPVNAAPPEVYHTVVFWLKPDTSAAKIDEITGSIKAMEKLPMVEKVIVGTPIMSERTVVDDSFSIAFTMTFKDEASLRAYNADPHHKKVSSEVTLPHVVRGLIYDYKSQ